MTNQEAIEILNNKEADMSYKDCEIDNAHVLAIEALETVESLQAELDQWKRESISDKAKLGEYKILEGQGLIVQLPCKVGDTLYGIMLDKLQEYKVFAINIGMREYGNSFVVLANNHRNAAISFELIDFGKTAFTTKEEAEKRLAELEGGVSNE